MRRKKENSRVFEPGDGVRRRYYEALEPGRFQHPRRGLVHHPLSWYLSDAPAKRPVFGVYALGALAEDMLWKSRFAKKPSSRPPFADAVRFFASTRRAMQNVLSTYRIDRRLTPRETGALRRVVARLAGAARELAEKTGNSHLTPSTGI